MNRNRIWKTVNIVLILLTLAFIWSRSLKSIEESKTESLIVGGWLTPFLEFFLGRGNVTDHIVRKLAHFCEFGLLGVESGILTMQMTKKRFKGVLIALVCGFFAGAADENIQYFTGRGNQFSDVMLDFSGFALGAVGITLIVLIVATIFTQKGME